MALLLSYLAPAIQAESVPPPSDQNERPTLCSRSRQKRTFSKFHRARGRRKSQADIRALRRRKIYICGSPTARESQSGRSPPIDSGSIRVLAELHAEPAVDHQEIAALAAVSERSGLRSIAMGMAPTAGRCVVASITSVPAGVIGRPSPAGSSWHHAPPQNSNKSQEKHRLWLAIFICLLPDPRRLFFTLFSVPL